MKFENQQRIHSVWRTFGHTLQSETWMYPNLVLSLCLTYSLITYPFKRRKKVNKRIADHIFRTKQLSF